VFAQGSACATLTALQVQDIEQKFNALNMAELEEKAKHNFKDACDYLLTLKKPLDEAIASKTKAPEYFTIPLQKTAEARCKLSKLVCDSLDVEAERLFSEGGKLVGDKNAFVNASASLKNKSVAAGWHALVANTAYNCNVKSRLRNRWGWYNI
jgi:hypothetical protein